MPTMPTALRNSVCDLVVDSADAGSGAATIEVRTGSTPGAGTLLLTWTLNDPAFGSAATGAAALAVGSTIQSTAVATGTAGHARLKDSNGTVVLELTVGTSGADVILSSLSITNGVAYQLTSGTVTQPAS